jgi:hypothetical protein
MVRFIVAEMVTNLKMETGDIMRFTLMLHAIGMAKHHGTETIITPCQHRGQETTHIPPTTQVTDCR